jgi:L-lysine 2,3-aminomutase
MQELRQVADAERQAAQQQAEENYRRDQNRINADRYAAEAPERAARAGLLEAQRLYYLRGGPGSNAVPRGTTLTPAAFNAIERAARADALREFPIPSGSELTTMTQAQRDARERDRAAKERELITRRVNAYVLSTPGALAASVTAAPAPPPPPAPAAIIDLLSRPSR